MRPYLPAPVKAALLACAIVLANRNALGLGSDWPNNLAASQANWPQGMTNLVNVTNRVHGFFVNDEDVFFFTGNATNFNEFLAAYSKIPGVEKHRLILEGGMGEAKSPWDKRGQPCDWKLYACPKSWLVMDPKAEAFVLEMHFWTGGKIALDQVAIPKNVEFTGECFKNFDSITNGMTRSEVEKRLTPDGGLQFVSPVRFIDPGCPGFKLNAGFDYKKDATDQNRAISGKDDKVINVSKPYLERPAMD